MRRVLPFLGGVLFPLAVSAQFLDRPDYGAPAPQYRIPQPPTVMPRTAPSAAPSAFGSDVPSMPSSPYSVPMPSTSSPVAGAAEDVAPSPPLAELPPPEITSEAASRQMVVDLAIIDKNLGRHHRLQVPMDRVVQYKTLELLPKRCVIESRADAPPQHSVLVDIYDRKAGSAASQTFSGWMFAGNPSLSHLAHPYYDVIAFACTPMPTDAASPAEETPGAAKSKEPANARPSS